MDEHYTREKNLAGPKYFTTQVNLKNKALVIMDNMRETNAGEKSVIDSDYLVKGGGL